MSFDWTLLVVADAALLILATLLKLKQICNHPAHALGDGSRLGGRSGKLLRFDELITDLLDADEVAVAQTVIRTAARPSDGHPAAGDEVLAEAARDALEAAR